MKPQLFLIFILTIKTSKSIEIFQDNTKNGLVFIPFTTINLRENDMLFHYTFNVTALQKILTEEKKLISYCTFNFSTISPIEVEIEFNVKWNNFKPAPKSKKLNAKTIEINFFYNNILTNYLNKLDFNQENRCENMKRLAHYFNIMNNELNKLSKLNTTSIEEILSLGEISTEIQEYLKSSNVHVLPFSLTQGYTEEFFKYTKFDYYYENYTVILEFEIPIYRRTNLYSVFVKPIIKRNTPYLLHTDIKYATFS